MLSPFVILFLQATSYILGALFLGFAIIRIRRNSARKKALVTELKDGSTDAQESREGAKKSGQLVTTVLLVLGVVALLLPFTSLFHWDYARIIRNYKKSREYRAPREQERFNSGLAPGAPNLTQARQNYKTKLKRKIKAPQDFDGKLTPPANADFVWFPSGDLELKAWVSKDPGDGKQHPAIVFLHGGFALGKEDWDVLAAYRKAGYVTITPSLRGENGNPGHFEFFYGEVSDALAAGEYVARLPYVDPERVHVTGHSIGGLICVLAAESESVFRSAVAFSPTSLDTAEWVEEIVSGKYTKQGSLQDPDLLVFNHKSKQEVTLRNPHEFAKQLQIPLVIYLERRRVHSVSDSFSYLAKETGKPLLMKQLYGADHSSMLLPSIQDTVSWFKLMEIIDPKTLNANNIAAAYKKRESDTSELADFLPANRKQLDEQAFRDLRFGMSEEEVEGLLGPEGHEGSFERSPRLAEMVESLTKGVLERSWVHDSGCRITTFFNANGKLVGTSRSGSDPFFEGKYDEISKNTGSMDEQAVENLLSESTFAILESRWRFKVWTSDSQIFVAQMDEQNKLDSVKSHPSIRINYRDFRGDTRAGTRSRD